MSRRLLPGVKASYIFLFVLIILSTCSCEGCVRVCVCMCVRVCVCVCAHSDDCLTFRGARVPKKLAGESPCPLDCPSTHPSAVAHGEHYAAGH